MQDVWPATGSRGKRPKKNSCWGSNICLSWPRVTPSGLMRWWQKCGPSSWINSSERWNSTISRTLWRLWTVLPSKTSGSGREAIEMENQSMPQRSGKTSPARQQTEKSPNSGSTTLPTWPWSLSNILLKKPARLSSKSQKGKLRGAAAAVSLKEYPWKNCSVSLPGVLKGDQKQTKVGRLVHQRLQLSIGLLII